MIWLLFATALGLIVFGLFLTIMGDRRSDLFFFGALIVASAGLFLGSAAMETETFNPATDDCTKWDCPTEKYGFNLFSVTQDDSECDYKTPEPYRVLGANVRHWSNRITFEGECVSWQPKTPSLNQMVVLEWNSELERYCGRFPDLAWREDNTFKGTENSVFCMNKSAPPVTINLFSQSGFPLANITFTAHKDDTAQGWMGEDIQKRNGLCPVNTTYQQTTCDCAKNINTPCMALCFECVPTKLIADATFFDGVDYNCYDLTEQECLDRGINLTKSALNYLKNESDNKKRDFCRDNPSDAEKCRCVRTEKKTLINSSQIESNCVRQGSFWVCVEIGEGYDSVVIDNITLVKPNYSQIFYEGEFCVEAVPK